MELNTENLTVGEGLNHFGHTIIGPTYNLQLGSQLLDSLMVEGIDLDFILAQNLMHSASLHHGHRMGGYRTFFFLTMVDVRWLFARQILIERTAHRHIDELKATADAQDRYVSVFGQLE